MRHCADCGEMLDQFGICPFADPERARLETAPVNCAHTAAENTAKMSDLIGDTYVRLISRVPKLPGMGIAGDQSGASR